MARISTLEWREALPGLEFRFGGLSATGTPGDTEAVVEFRLTPPDGQARD